MIRRAGPFLTRDRVPYGHTSFFLKEGLPPLAAASSATTSIASRACLPRSQPRHSEYANQSCDGACDHQMMARSHFAVSECVRRQKEGNSHRVGSSENYLVFFQPRGAPFAHPISPPCLLFTALSPPAHGALAIHSTARVAARAITPPPMSRAPRARPPRAPTRRAGSVAHHTIECH